MDQFVLHKDRWFAWQMIPGYVGERSVPYCSPIYVTEFTPLKSGKNVFKIEFLNVFYAQGVQDFSVDIRVLKRAKDYLVGEILYDPKEDSGRCAVISHIEFEWIKKYCPELWFYRPPSTCVDSAGNSVSTYLNEVFFRGEPDR